MIMYYVSLHIGTVNGEAFIHIHQLEFHVFLGGASAIVVREADEP